MCGRRQFFYFIALLIHLSVCDILVELSTGNHDKLVEIRGQNVKGPRLDVATTIGTFSLYVVNNLMGSEN